MVLKTWFAAASFYFYFAPAIWPASGSLAGNAHGQESVAFIGGQTGHSPAAYAVSLSREFLQDLVTVHVGDVAKRLTLLDQLARLNIAVENAVELALQPIEALKQSLVVVDRPRLGLVHTQHVEHIAQTVVVQHLGLFVHQPQAADLRLNARDSP